MEQSFSIIVVLFSFNAVSFPIETDWFLKSLSGPIEMMRATTIVLLSQLLEAIEWREESLLVVCREQYSQLICFARTHSKENTKIKDSRHKEKGELTKGDWILLFIVRVSIVYIIVETTHFVFQHHSLLLSISFSHTHIKVGERRSCVSFNDCQWWLNWAVPR